MARKREKLKKLDYHSKEYWSKLLTQEGLSMERGTSRRLTYVGGSSVAESIDGEQYTRSGRIPPKPQAQ
jgi:hypothetical protein